MKTWHEGTVAHTAQSFEALGGPSTSLRVYMYTNQHPCGHVSIHACAEA